jgi:glycosyltransferase involved in cell wall biosynthesis
MVTRDRTKLARRALRCLEAQTWPNLELVVIDDGDEDYTPLLAPLKTHMAVRHVRLVPEPGRRLGALRNLALDEARGEICVQWDDDEWYHPERIAAQVAALEDKGVAAVVLHYTLMHVDVPELASRAFRGACFGGTPGTVLHRRTAVRYPNLPRAEDTHFLRALARAGGVTRLGRQQAHLFIRCFHGSNTWGLAHFTERLRRTPLDWIYSSWAWLRRDVTAHPAFRLRPAEAAALASFLEDSRSLGLIAG